MDIAELQIGSPISQAKIETACQRLQDSGIFQSVEYRYAPGPNKGYALTLTIGDQLNLADASIDIPGVQEAEAWQWLSSRYPLFNRKVPEVPAAQQYIAQKLEDYLKDKLNGQKIIAELESNLETQQLLVSFQPQSLPRITAMNFSGQKELSADQLREVMNKAVSDRGYIERQFRSALEMNVRNAYEESGMYRVKFNRITAALSGSSVAVTTEIEEGPKFTLGKAEFSGDDLPVSALLKAASFKLGKTANWTEIQQGVWEAERRLKRTGFFEATAQPEKILHDGSNTLDLKVSFNRGPLFRFSELRIRGLTASQESQARKIWKLNPGDPFDYGYASDFLQAFFQSVNPKQFRKFDVNMFRDPAGQPKMGFELVFVP